MTTARDILPRPASPALNMCRNLIPGLLTAFAIALTAIIVQDLSDLAILSPLIVAVSLGLLLGNTMGTTAKVAPGITFTQKTLLRLGIVLLGLRVTQDEVLELGAPVLLVVAAALTTTFIVIQFLGQILRVPPDLTTLIAAGTSVCGASAVIAANAVTHADEEDVTYAIACVTVLGTLTMALFPLVAVIMPMDARTFGIWSGSSVHEVAQVAAVAFQYSETAGEFATISKLFRVVLLAPLVLLLSVGSSQRPAPKPGQTTTFPWFVVGFFMLVCLNSIVVLPPAVIQTAGQLSTFLLTAALGAMGLNTRIDKLRIRGLRPALLGILGSIYIAGFSLTMLMATQ